MDWRHQAACRDHDPELWFSGKPYEQAAALAIMRGTATPGRDVTHPECFGRFTVVALSYGGAIRKCMRRVAQMCAKHSACEQLDRQEARA